MALPLGTERVGFISAKDMDSGLEAKGPVPGSIEATDQIQKIYLRLQEDWEGQPAWFVTQTAIPQDVDTVLIGDQHFILRLCGQISKDNDGSIHLRTEFKTTYKTPIKDAPLIETPIVIVKADRLILENGRVFFLNGDRDEYVKSALSLGISASF